MRCFCVSRPGFSISAQAIRAGQDLTVVISGGSRPHIGCVCLAVPRPSLREGGGMRATVSTINVTGHKDDEIAVRFAQTLAAAGCCVCAVSCGIHLDGLTDADLRQILDAAQELLQQLVQAVETKEDCSGSGGSL